MTTSDRGALIAVFVGFAFELAILLAYWFDA
jgi:hypothetical protein